MRRNAPSTARVLLTLTLLSPTLAAAQSGWRGADGKLAPDTADMKTRDGFSAALLITADADWEAKWDTPPETVPHFTAASMVSNGGELHILTILSNPALDAASKTDVTCDFKVVRPDGSPFDRSEGDRVLPHDADGEPRERLPFGGVDEVHRGAGGSSRYVAGARRRQGQVATPGASAGAFVQRRMMGQQSWQEAGSLAGARDEQGSRAASVRAGWRAATGGRPYEA